MNNLKPGIYKHYKGNMYRVLFIAKHSETLEDMVVYEALYEKQLSKYFVRPMAMFDETVEVDGKKQLRFEYIGE